MRRIRRRRTLFIRPAHLSPAAATIHSFQISDGFRENRCGTVLTEVEMFCSQIQVLLVALCSSMLVVHVTGAPQMNELTQTLQAELIADEDLTDFLLLRLMSELMASREEEMLGELEDDEVGGSERLMRRHIRFTHRQRKAGCRNFFWKTFTSC
ncbi:hypothetical protein AMECASPLE_005377 [Ameca splendens]|uniref:Somatostatin/Cortistatin C-terminal domain-containing protein n=1 Tax=Ameca splendens TaxID=208324 RepID=A0ABV0ZA43_9TELE